MNAVPAIALDFDEGIDRKTLKKLRGRFEQVNRQRLQRALQGLGPRQSLVLELLPLIFHLNHPALPGYLDTRCPQGLALYTPDRDVLDAAQRFSRSFHWRSQGAPRPDLDSLFVMGSPGTIAQTGRSDLDVWLCHRRDLTAPAIALLLRKAEALERWAADFGVELHIFVLSADGFRGGRLDQRVDDENCGSAQHYLLLDEFYRTAIHLGGKFPLWWLIPAEREQDYAELVRQLVECRFIKAEEYLDFGPIPSIPPAEFVGAGIWQLYKGIDAPWKAILKLLLIENYAGEHQRPLALAFKEAVFGGQLDADEVDPYVMLYRFLEGWLLSAGAEERLELLRRSFYLKASLPLSRLENPRNDWRANLLLNLVHDWGWDDTQIRRLDRRPYWRVGEVQRERRTIVNALTHSYRFLSRLAREQGVRASIRPEDMTLLGRKLYAAFQRKAGKIEVINPGIAPSLAEENLAFHHRTASPEGGSGDGWLLYRDLDNPADAAFQPVIKHSASLIELLVWCHCNGLLTSATRLNVQAGRTRLSVTELRSLIQGLQQDIRTPITSPDRSALLEDPRPLATVLFVNVGVDPLESLSEKGLQKLSERSDALGFSGVRDNLIVTVDQVGLNSWHEVSVQRYEAGDTLIQCLNNYLASLMQSSGARPALSVHCYCAGRAAAIARRVEELFVDVAKAFFADTAEPRSLRYLIEMDRRWFQLQFVDGQPRFVAVSGYPELLTLMALPQTRYAPLVIDRYALTGAPAIRAVCAASEPDNIQLFYEIKGEQADLWLVDELGSLWYWPSAFQSVRYLLSPVLRFLANVNERRQLRRALHDGSPPLEVGVVELVRRGAEYVLEKRRISDDGFPESCFEIQAVGIQDAESPLRFDLFCDHQEFSSLEHGDRLLAAVAHYVRSRRRGGENYPVYITDMSLPHDLDPQRYQRDLSTVQYLQQKLSLEQALNRALERLP